MSNRPASLTVVPDLPAPAFSAQREAVLGVRAEDMVAAAGQWSLVAQLLDELVCEYDARLASADGDVLASGGQQLQELMDAFDLLGTDARTNADVLEDLAAEITLAQARMATVGTDYQADRSHARAAATGLIDRRFDARSAREVWYPLEGSVEAAAAALRPVPASDAPEQAGSYATLVQLSTS